MPRTERTINISFVKVIPKFWPWRNSTSRLLCNLCEDLFSRASNLDNTNPKSGEDSRKHLRSASSFEKSTLIVFLPENNLEKNKNSLQHQRYHITPHLYSIQVISYDHSSIYTVNVPCSRFQCYYYILHICSL